MTTFRTISIPWAASTIHSRLCCARPVPDRRRWGCVWELRPARSEYRKSSILPALAAFGVPRRRHSIWSMRLGHNTAQTINCCWGGPTDTMDPYRVGSFPNVPIRHHNLHTRRQDCDSSARCDRLTGKSYLTGSVRVADDRGVICWLNISLLGSWLLMNPQRRSSNSL